jgi:hypothetical protein
VRDGREYTGRAAGQDERAREGVIMQNYVFKLGLRKPEWNRSRLLSTIAEMAWEYDCEIRTEYKEVSSQVAEARITLLETPLNEGGRMVNQHIHYWQQLPGVTYCHQA